MSAAETNKEITDFVMQYGGRCRDCADHDGVCPSSGLPCNSEDARKAIRHVIHALAYGQVNGYLPGPYRKRQESSS